MDRSPILNPEAISNCQLLINEKLVFSIGASLGIQITLNGRSYTSLYILEGFCLFVCFVCLSHTAFLGNFYLTGIFVYILWFLILCGVCVCFSLMLFLMFFFFVTA